jgi:hypothetical protein
MFKIVTSWLLKSTKSYISPPNQEKGTYCDDSHVIPSGRDSLTLVMNLLFKTTCGALLEPACFAINHSF